MILMKTLPNKKLMIGNCMRLFIENQMINFRRTKMKPWHLRMNKVMVVMRMNLLQTDNSINDTKIYAVSSIATSLDKVNYDIINFDNVEVKEVDVPLEKKWQTVTKKKPRLPQNPSKISVKLHKALYRTDQVSTTNSVVSLIHF